MVKKEAVSPARLSVRSYQNGIDMEKRKMGPYSKKFGTRVRSLQSDWKSHAKDLKVVALRMREDGIKNMTQKVRKYEGDIKYQIAENKEAVARIENSVKFFKSEINKKMKDFQAYARGPFQGYIKAFWG